MSRLYKILLKINADLPPMGLGDVAHNFKSQSFRTFQWCRGQLLGLNDPFLLRVCLLEPSSLQDIMIMSF